MQIISNQSSVKTIQRGTATLSSVMDLNVSISSVNLSKSSLNFSFSGFGGASAANEIIVSGRFTSSTVLRFYRPSGTGSVVVEWEVVEYV